MGDSLQAQDWARDSLQVNVSEKQTERSKEFYQNLKERLGSNWFTKELYNFLLDDDSLDYHAIEKLKTIRSERQFEPYNGKRIGRLHFVPLQPFGTSVNDPKRASDSEFSQFANNIQIDSRIETLRKSLILRCGEDINNFRLADAERVLRSQAFISEARLKLIQNPVDTNFYDIDIILEEAWTISLDYDSSPYTREWELYDGNFLGLGHRFSHRAIFPTAVEYETGYRGQYQIYNAFQTRGSLDFVYEGTYRNRSGILSYQSDFLSPSIRWGGGFLAAYHNFTDNDENPAQTIFRHRRNEQKAWLGYSFALLDHGLSFFTRDRMIVAAAIERWDYDARSPLSTEFFRAYQDRRRYLMSLSFNKRNYYKASMIYGFGRTEDVPTGYLFQLTGGIETRSEEQRPYVGFAVSAGDFLKKFGYLHADLNIGGFPSNNRFEDAVLDIKLNYFTNFKWIGRSQFRNFIEVQFTQGSERQESDFINLLDQQGIRGLNLSQIIGDKRLIVKVESVLFTPLHLYGFNVAVFGFADFGWIARKNSALTFSNGAYQGFGMGFRFRNENLIFPTLQMRFSLYPRVPFGINVYEIGLGGQRGLRVNDFVPGAPAIITFD